jgi:hypothetical protein
MLIVLPFDADFRNLPILHLSDEACDVDFFDRVQIDHGETASNDQNSGYNKQNIADGCVHS